MNRISALLILLASLMAGSAAQQFGPWSAAVNLGAVVNSSANDQHPTLSKDGLTLIFASDRHGSFGDFDLWVSQRDSLDSPWQTPANLTMLNTAYREYAPNLTTDGHWLFFHSKRPGGCQGGANQELWAAHRQDKRDDFGWEQPINLGCVLNTAADNAGPNFFDDGNGTLYLYFTRNLTPANQDGFDIYVSTCTADLSTCNRDQLWSPGSIVNELSTPVRDTRTAIRRRDGLEMIISTNRAPGNVGSSDLWVSTRATTQDPWSIPANLDFDTTHPLVNSPAFDGAPALSWDGQTLIFYSMRPGGFGGSDLYVSTRTPLTSH